MNLALNNLQKLICDETQTNIKLILDLVWFDNQKGSVFYTDKKNILKKYMQRNMN